MFWFDIFWLNLFFIRIYGYSSTSFCNNQLFLRILYQIYWKLLLHSHRFLSYVLMASMAKEKYLLLVTLKQILVCCILLVTKQFIIWTYEHCVFDPYLSTTLSLHGKIRSEINLYYSIFYNVVDVGIFFGLPNFFYNQVNEIRRGVL